MPRRAADGAGESVQGLVVTVGEIRSKMKKSVLMQREYVERRDGAYYVTGSRVSLASIVYEYRDGAAPETIRQNFPTLSLEQATVAVGSTRGCRSGE